MAGISQTKTYGVSYILYGNSENLTKALAGAKTQAEGLQTALAQANANLHTIFGGKADVPKAITELRDFYKEWATANKTGGSSLMSKGLEKQSKILKDTQKKLKQIQDSPFTIKNGMIGREAFTNIQKQIDQHVFNVKVKPVLSGDAKVTLQEQLSKLNLTVNVKANPIGFQEQKPGTASSSKSASSKSGKTSKSAKINTTGLKYVSWDQIPNSVIKADAQLHNALRQFRVAEDNFLAASRASEAYSGQKSALEEKLAKLKNPNGKRANEIRSSIARVDSILSKQKAIRGKIVDTYYQAKDNLQSAFDARKKYGETYSPLRSGLNNTSSSKKAYTSPTAKASLSPMGQMQQSIKQFQNLAKSSPININSRWLGGELAQQVSVSLGNIQNLVNSRPILVRGRWLGGELAQQASMSLGNLQSLVSQRGISVLPKMPDSKGLNKALADIQKLTSSKTIPIEGKLNTAKINEQIKAFKPSPITIKANIGWGTGSTSKVSQIKKLSEGLKPLSMSVNLDISKAKAKLQQLKTFAASMSPLNIGTTVASGNKGTTQAAVQSQVQRATTASMRASANSGPVASAMMGRRNNDLYTRMRKSWYPFTGNTSFGARTPMALDMAKGMGMMFAVSGVMQAVTSSFHQVAEYENMMKTVQAILKTNDSGANFNGRFKAMEEEVRRVGRETKFTAPEVAGAARFMAMAGLGIEDINAATNPIANLALVGDNDMSTTADKMTNIMTSFGLLKGLTGSQKKANMRHTSDVLTNTFTKSNTDLIQLAEAMQYAGPMSHLTGTSLEDAAAMVGVMGNAGIQSSMAGTTLRMMYQNIIKPNKKQAAEWKRLGINTKDDQGRNRDIFEILKDLRAKITGTTDLNSKVGADQLKIMGAEVMSLFRTTAGAGTAALLENLGEAINLAQSNRESNGVAQTIADEKKNTISGLWAQVTSTFTDQSVNTVNEFVETIKDMLRSLRDWLASKEAAETLRTIYDLAKSIIDIFGSVAKVWLKIYNFAPGVVKWFITIQMWATQMGFLVTPIIQVVGAITTLKNTLLGFVGSLVGASAMASRGRTAGIVSSVTGGLSFVPKGARGAKMATAADVLSGATPKGRFLREYQRRAELYSNRDHYKNSFATDGFTHRNPPLAPFFIAGGWRKSGGSGISSATDMVHYNAERVRRIKAYRYARAAEKAEAIKKRANSIYGTGKVTRSFSVGRQMGSFANMGLMLAPMWQGIKVALINVGATAMKVLGMIASPIGLITAAVGGLAFIAYKFYDNIQKAKEQTEALSDTVKRMNQSFNALTKDAYQYESEKGGFKPIEIGYQPTKNYSEQSLEGDKDAKRYLDAENMSGAAVYEDVAASGYYKYLTPSIINTFKSGRYDNEFARRAGLISVWQKRAIEDDTVRNAERAIIDAQTSGNYAKANEIVKAFADEVFLATKRMSELKEVQDVYDIKNPQDYKEWAMAQYQYIKEFKESVRPFESYKRAMYTIDYMNKHKDEDLLHDTSFMKGLATTFMKSFPHLGKNGSSGQLIFDKTGHISWSAMAKKFNDGKDYNMAERYNIVKNIYDQMAQNEKMQKQPEILQMLRTYLPKLAGQNGLWVMPGDEVKYRDKFNPEDWREAVIAWHQLSGQYTGKKTADKFFKDKLWETVPNMNKISAWYREKYLSDAASKDDGKSGVTPPGTTDQSAYDSKYNNHQARPTQIIFNIDQLCKFEGTQVNSLDQKGIAESVGRQMAEGLHLMFAQAASDFAIIGDSNG